MNESLRWQLIVGCLMIAVLEAPRTSIVLAEDLGGPYAARRTGSFDAAPPAVQRIEGAQSGAYGVVAGEELVALDRIRSTPSRR